MSMTAGSSSRGRTWGDDGLDLQLAGGHVTPETGVKLLGLARVPMSSASLTMTVFMATGTLSPLYQLTATMRPVGRRAWTAWTSAELLPEVSMTMSGAPRRR